MLSARLWVVTSVRPVRHDYLDGVQQLLSQGHVGRGGSLRCDLQRITVWHLDLLVQIFQGLGSSLILQVKECVHSLLGVADGDELDVGPGQKLLQQRDLLVLGSILESNFLPAEECLRVGLAPDDNAWRGPPRSSSHSSVLPSTHPGQRSTSARLLPLPVIRHPLVPVREDHVDPVVVRLVLLAALLGDAPPPDPAADSLVPEADLSVAEPAPDLVVAPTATSMATPVRPVVVLIVLPAVVSSRSTSCDVLISHLVPSFPWPLLRV